MKTRLLAVSAAVLLVGCSSVSPLVIGMHVSGATVSGPADQSIDFAGAGVALDLGNVEIDAALGRRALRCSLSSHCPSDLGGMALIRWTPGE